MSLPAAHDSYGKVIMRIPGSCRDCSIDARHWLDGAIWRVTGSYVFSLSRSARWRVSAMRLDVEKEQGDRGLAEIAERRAGSA